MERKPFDPNVEESINAITEDFKQALINECNLMAHYSHFESINYICLDSAIKMVPNILKMVSEVGTIGLFGELQGRVLNQSFDLQADARVTRALAQDIRDKMGDDIPKDIKEKIDEILKRLGDDRDTE